MLQAARDRGVRYVLGFSITAPYFMTKNDQLKEVLGKVLKDIDSIDWAAKEKDKLGRLGDWLGENALKQDKPKTIKDMKDLMNVYLLVEMSFADR